jgi:hypothetical protein
VSTEDIDIRDACAETVASSASSDSRSPADASGTSGAARPLGPARPGFRQVEVLRVVQDVVVAGTLVHDPLARSKETIGSNEATAIGDWNAYFPRSTVVAICRGSK